MSNVVTVTELLTYKRCRLLWDMIYRQHLTPRMESNFFYIGRLVHQTLAEWTVNPERDCETIFMEVLQSEMEALKKRYEENVGARMSDAEMDDRIASTALPMEMVVNYQAYWKQPLPDGFKLIAPEQTCLVDIPNTGHWRCEKGHKLDWKFPSENDLQQPARNCSTCGALVYWRSMQLEGTLDGFVVDETTGRFYVLERKTYEARPKIDSLENQEQFVAYSWILRQLFPDAVLGGVLYDGLWKRAQPPRGRVESDLFLRELLLKGQHELDYFEQNLTAVATDILEGPAIFPTRIWQGCYDDKDFDRLCSAIAKGDDVDYIRDEYYVERAPRWFENIAGDEAV